MKSDIIFHIGYPKTATTFLQQGVFRELKALGACSIVDGSLPIENKLRSFVCHAGPEVWPKMDGQKLASQIKEYVVPGRTLLYSSEYWLRGPLHFYIDCQKPKMPDHQTHLAIEHLSAFKDHCWQDIGDVKVLVTIRNQISWFGSRYAQLSDRRDVPGQEDFEWLVQKTLAENGPGGNYFLNYLSLYQGLCEVLGEENVLFLPMEETGSFNFWSKLEKWSGLIVEKKIRENKQKNKRSLLHEQWKTRPSSRYSRLKMINSCECGMRGVAEKIARKVAKKIEFSLGKTDIIKMTPELRKAISESYCDSNKQLAEAIGVDLAQYGYF